MSGTGESNNVSELPQDSKMEESEDNPVVCGPKEKVKKCSPVWDHFEKKIKPNTEIIERQSISIVLLSMHM